jgi:hypothetical protein
MLDNLVTLSQAPVDWSPSAGPIWLVAFFLVVVVTVGAVAVVEAARG